MKQRKGGRPRPLLRCWRMAHANPLTRSAHARDGRNFAPGCVITNQRLPISRDHLRQGAIFYPPDSTRSLRYLNTFSRLAILPWSASTSFPLLSLASSSPLPSPVSPPFDCRFDYTHWVGDCSPTPPRPSVVLATALATCHNLALSAEYVRFEKLR